MKYVAQLLIATFTGPPGGACRHHQLRSLVLRLDCQPKTLPPQTHCARRAQLTLWGNMLEQAILDVEPWI